LLIINKLTSKTLQEAGKGHVRDDIDLRDISRKFRCELIPTVRSTTNKVGELALISG